MFRNWVPVCPRCGSRTVISVVGILRASDEQFEATHECSSCGTRFRVTPPKQVQTQ